MELFHAITQTYADGQTWRS